MNEVNLIQKYFSSPYIGDDAAVLSVPTGQDLVVTMDTLNQGIHFPDTTSPFDIGYKAAMVNISDLAAMGAQPAWATLSISLPEINENWLAEFSRGLFAALDKYQIQLVGGDTNRGSLSVTLQLHGFVPHGKALLRSGAQVGDVICVSGELGTAAFALQCLQGKYKITEAELSQILPALNRPEAQVALGLALRDIATSCIDLSDGLGKDLQHILTRSGVGADVELAKLPIHPILKNHLNPEEMYALAINGGDDYQLCFTVPADKIDQLNTFSVTAIGQIVVGQQLLFRNAVGEVVELTSIGYQHF